MRHFIGVILVSAVMMRSAHAQSGDASAIAEQLFSQGRELAKANQWANACPKFEASLHYDPLLGTRLNLAACYEHIGKLAGAWGLYREAIDIAKEAGDIKRRDYAQQQVALLEPRLAKLMVLVPAKPPVGFVVTRDDLQIERGAFGVALYVDPGLHEINASAPGFEPLHQSVTTVEGKTETFTVPDLKPSSVRSSSTSSIKNDDTTAGLLPEKLAPQTPTGTNVANEPSAWRKQLMIGAGLAGVTAISLGLLYGLNADMSYNDAKILCGTNLRCTPSNYDQGKQLIEDTRSSAIVSTIFVTVGAAALAGTIVMALRAPGARAETTTKVIPVTQDHGAGLAVVGRF